MSGKITAEKSITGYLGGVSNIPVYTGEYSVEPSEEETVLPTAGKRMTDNVTVGAARAFVQADGELSATSENPVQNKVITAALAGKADADDIPDISGLARQSELDALAETVSEKAEASALEALAGTVNGKADVSALEALAGTVNGKADVSALEALAGTVNGKADASALDGKVDKETGKGLSANDYTNDDKAKLAGIAAGATNDAPDGETLKRNAAGAWYVNIAANAGAHNAIYRGKYLGDHVTDEQYAAIAAGTFDDLFIGDYWTIGGVNWRVASFDYYLGCGDTETTEHHAVIVPDSCLYNAKMNESNTTAGAYVGSAMYGSDWQHTGGGLAQAVTMVNAAFGGHVLRHRILLQNEVNNGKATLAMWADSRVDLMTEQMVYGGAVFNPANDGVNVPANYRVEKTQLALFAHEPCRIAIRYHWWLRDVVSACNFAGMNNFGNARYHEAHYALGVRPAFCIYGGNGNAGE